MNSKTNKGITLIALVITIIVLLILAGVTISMVLGDDGIIAQASQAKQSQEDAEEKEQEEILKGQGNIDLYTAGTVANKVKVGDYVKYNYTAPTEGYTTPTGDEGVNETTQNFKSTTGGNAEVTAWRVLSKKDGIVKLISEEPVSSMTMKGKKGYLNGPDVLNEMCKTLYSSSIGKSRSINVDDVNEAAGYKPSVGSAYDVNGNNMNLPYGTTIKEAAKTAGSGGIAYDMDNFNSAPENGKYVGDYKITYYNYGEGDYVPYDKQEEAYELLFDFENGSSCWLANSCVEAWFNANYANFDVRYFGKINGVNTVAANWMWAFGSMEIDASMAVQPIVTLNTGLEIKGGDGKTAETGWEIKGN